MSLKKSKEPTGKERMKRSPPSDMSLRPKKFEFDIKKAYSAEQLAEIGAIALVWNQVEWALNWLLWITVDPKNAVAMQLVRQTINADKQIKLLRNYYDENDILNEEAKKVLKSTFDAVIDLRTYRNAIVHSTVFDHEKGIAHFIDQSHKPFQILVTKEALLAVYERLVILKDELRETDLLMRIAQGAARITYIDDKTHIPEPDQPKALRERAVPEQLARILVYQNKRLSFPPLPEFPDAHLIRQTIVNEREPV